MSDYNSTTSAGNVPQGADALRTFQLTTESIKDKSSKEYGTSIAKQINGYVMSGLQGYFYRRNARFVKNRNYANGRIDVQAMFKDRFQFNGKTNYISLNWNTLQIVNRIVSGLVGRWMKRNEKIQIKAIDSLSQNDKREEYENFEFIIEQRNKIEQLQQESGQQLVPEGVPEDKEALNIWRAEMQRTPEEIINEMGCNDVLTSNGWYDVLKEKMLHDAAETLFVGTYVCMGEDGVIKTEWLKPENCIYSYSDYPDFRDTSWRGYMPSRKISELRRMWGKEFNPNNPNALSEQDLFEIAQKCKDFQYWNNLQWTDIWATSYLRPYDEWNLRTIEFELKSPDSESYTKTTTNLTGSTYIEKGLPKTRSGKPKPKSDNQEIIQDTNWNIYRGVYLPDCDRLLEWGIKTNMIRPQDPREIGNAEFSYSFYMPQNYAMKNLAVPEKIEAAVDGMILALLKMQQIMARLVPSGWVINETALQNIDYGLGDEGNKSVDHTRQFFQTGLLYYRGVDEEGRPVPPPITELQNAGFSAQMQGLIQNYQFNYQALKDELGEDPNLISAALQPRVTGDNVEASQLQSEYATDYIYKAYTECMKITSRKISCLLKDSIQYGSAAYRHIAGKNDVDDRIFTTDIRFLPSDFEIQRFEGILNQTIATNQDIILFIDPFQLMRVAREDVKLAELLFRQAQKKMIAWQRQTAQENQQQTINGQIQSAQAAEQAKGQNMKMELQMKGAQSEQQGKVEKQKIAYQGAFQLLNTIYAPQKSGDGATATPTTLPSDVQQLLSLIVKNATIDFAQDNKELVEDIAQDQIQEQQQQQAQPEAQEQPEQVAA